MPQYGWSEDEIYLVAGRAHSLYSQGRCLEAAMIFKGLLAADPQNAYVSYALATTCLALGQTEQAMSLLTAMIERDPGNIEARARRCDVLLKLGKGEAASVEFSQLKALLPTAEAARLEARLRSARQ